MKELYGKVAVVTGAGSGIGRSLAQQLAAAGCHLALADINDKALEQTHLTIESAGAKSATLTISLHNIDVSNRQQVEDFSQAVADQHGKVNLLFNNAGVALGAAVADASYDDMHWLMNINFWGVVHCCKAFLPLLKQSGDAHIVNISSVFGLMAVPTQSIYNASKFAVRGFTDALRQELLAQGVGVSTAFPAGIKTSIAQNARLSMGAENEQSMMKRKQDIEKLFLTTADQAAIEILAGVKKAKPRILVGRGSSVIDFATRLTPVHAGKLLGVLSS